MKNKKLFLPFYPICRLVLSCLFFITLSASGQNPNSIEQDPNIGVNSNQVNTDLPQRNLRRAIPAEMLELQMVAVPQLVGRNYDLNQITRILNRYGLRIGTVVPVAKIDSVGLVTSQYPLVGQRVRPQSIVNITYGISMPIATPTQPQTVIVPNYIGLTVERAVGRMPNDRLAPGNINEIHYDTQSGIVVNQFPNAGTQVDPGSQISLDSSIGPQEVVVVPVPRLIGLTLQQAAAVLRTTKLFVGNINERVSGEPDGTIIDQSPRPETEVSLGSSIDITYSISADEQLIPVPNVRQLPREEAIRVIKESGLNYSIKNVSESGQPKGVVIDQEPPPETMVAAGSNVIIFVHEENAIVPPWVYWVGGVLVAGLLGGIIGRKISPGNKKKSVGEKDVEVKLKPVSDPGKQTVSFERNSLVLNNLHIKFISDGGTQTLITE